MEKGWQVVRLHCADFLRKRPEKSGKRPGKAVVYAAYAWCRIRPESVGLEPLPCLSDGKPRDFWLG